MSHWQMRFEKQWTKAKPEVTEIMLETEEIFKKNCNKCLYIRDLSCLEQNLHIYIHTSTQRL
jgi:hypothetical protein